MKSLMRYGAVVCALGLGACGDGATGPADTTPLLNADLAQVVADEAGQDVEIMREPVTFTTMGGFAPPALGLGDLRPLNCTYNAQTGRVVCPPITRDITIERSYAFYDAANAPMPDYDPLLTASVNIRTHLEGERTQPNWSASVERDRDMTATGLLGLETQRTWNGTGSSEVRHSRHTENGPNRTYEASCTVEVDDVVVPVPRGDEPWPLSGTVTRSCTVTFVGGPRDGQTVTRTGVLTFNGTQFATLTLGGETYQIDLRNRRRHRQGG